MDLSFHFLFVSFFLNLPICSPSSGLALSLTDLFIILTPLLLLFLAHPPPPTTTAFEGAKVRLRSRVAAHSCNYTCPAPFSSFVSCFPAQTHVCVTPLYLDLPLWWSCLIFHLRNEEADLAFAFLKITIG